LELNVWETAEDAFLVVVGYSTDLFDATTVRRLTGYLESLLREAMADAGRRFTDLPLLSAAERHQLTAEWSDTRRTAAPLDAVARFAAQVERSPDAVALEIPSSGERLSYRELSRRALRLAARLRREGVTAGVAVGLFIDRTPELAIGLLGIWQAGGAFLPLDPGLPAARLGYLLEDSQVTVLVTSPQLAGALPPHGARLILLDREDSAGAATGESTASTIEPRSLAYLIYTSGTTGRPKAVLAEHGNLASTLAAVQEVFSCRPGDRLPAIASFSFDIFLFELLGPLLSGGTCILFPLRPTLDLERLALALHQATLFHAVPAVMRQIVELGRREPGGFAALRGIFTGGDTVPADLLVDFRAAFPRAASWVLYGPTEAAIVCTAWAVPAVPGKGPLQTLLGHPLPGAVLQVVESSGQLAPLGVPGEIWIGGAGVTRGYWRRPELNAEKFVEVGGERFFRSGDLARWRPAGNLEFLGRADQQVKVRGFRIELGEIEAQLLRHPEVRAAVVAVHDDPLGPLGKGRQLVAYIVRDQERGRTAAAEESREQVAQWQALYEETYGRSQKRGTAEATFDIEGWNSSYSGRPIPEEEMREWVERTAESILALAPRRVIEVGCGTGLLLFRLAAHTESYLGTDFSRVALDGIRQRLAEPGAHLPQVALREGAADDWSGVPNGAADLVILNSVVQYFPDVDYLVRVLRGAVASTAGIAGTGTGGRVFVGDVRSRPLLPALAAGVELFQAPDCRPMGELAQRVRRRVAGEEELVLDPAFFLALPRHLPEITRVDLRLKRGRFRNELTCFRFDVVLTVGERGPRAAPEVALDGRELRLAEIENYLAEQPESLVLSGLANARLSSEAALLALLAEPDGAAETVAEVRRALQAADVSGGIPAVIPGIDPEALCLLAERSGYAVELTVDPAAPLHFGAVLTRLARGGERPVVASRPMAVGDLPLRTLANDPLAARLARRLGPSLRTFLAAELPEYMVPGTFMVLDELPITTHGKVDRAALPEPEWQPQGSRGGARPRTAVEERMAALWRELLGVDEPSLEDNFFELGGHSLLATQLISRVRSSFGVEVPLRRIYERPTLGELAASLATVESGETEALPAMPAMPRAGGQEPAEAPLSFAQERLWFIDRLTGTGAYNVPLALTLEGSLSPAALAAALTEIVRRHGVLRTTFALRGGSPVQVVSPLARFSLPLVDLTHLPRDSRDNEARRWVRESALQAFDLERGPLLRTALLKTGEREHTLLLALHHIVSDGWSMGVLVAEIVPLYRAALAGSPSPLPPLPMQYGDFALWQRRQISGEVLAQELQYWRTQLSDSPADLGLPLDRPRPRQQSYRGARVLFPLAAEPILALRRDIAHSNTTLFMALLAVFQAHLGRYCGREDILVGSPIANRTRTETAPLIGFFVNTVVLRTAVKGSLTFRQLLAAVRRTATAAYTHQ
ncbi:MAG TPA: amino acid adenylation domain-containing protein, partial [Thermoanaerobaculia bacterium]|nr:amino acid adenylation domain-containing protein [Thermoanaerobaculia bacterium]